MSLKKNIFYSASLNVLNLLFPIITAPYISRVLGVENIGLVNFVTAYVSYFVLFAALGVNYYGVREIARHKNSQEETSGIFSGLLIITLIAAFAVTACYLATVFFVPMLRKDWPLFVLAGFSLYLAPISIDWYFRGLEDFKVITYRFLVVKVVSFAGLFLFVRQREDVIPYILLSAFSIVGSYIWNLAYAHKQGLRLKWKNLNLKAHIKPMFVFFATNIAVSVFTLLQTLMLGFLSDYEQVGLFTTPNKLLIVITSIFGATNTALLPRLSFNQQRNDKNANAELLQKAFDIITLLVIPAAVGLCLISKRFVPFFFGGEFTGSIVPMQILSFKVILVMINSFFALNILVVFGHENQYLLAMLVTALFSCVMNLYMIPKHGAIGASVTNCIAETIEIPFNLFFVYRCTSVRINWRHAANAFLMSLPFVGIYFLCNLMIKSTLLFLVIFMAISIALYGMLQLFLLQNYLMLQTYNRISKFLKDNRPYHK
jgi:O-antigen/teichoic acid export membrane protein